MGWGRGQGEGGRQLQSSAQSYNVGCGREAIPGKKNSNILPSSSNLTNVTNQLAACAGQGATQDVSVTGKG